ncbi:MAG: histidinol-phosphatase HisJ family protein [Nitrospiraceae bacterium]|nr:histidinol-phosphatase HisJ family protein [Nitrospiraceae bacterium]
MVEESNLRGQPWAVSLHGGHSGAYCDHAAGTLRETIEAAVLRGYHTIGVAEHAPRTESRYLYPEEIEMGWDVAKIAQDFEDYARELGVLSEEFADRIGVLRGFEAEVVPSGSYAQVMHGLRERLGFDYIVGSVHWVDDVIIDYTQAEFDRAAAQHGGLEGLAVRYYAVVAEMVDALRPEVVGHLDLLRKFGGSEGYTDTPAIQRAARDALAVIRDHGCILDLNTIGLRRGQGTPYPAPWLLGMAAHEFGIPFCFGDDSHGPADVGAGVAEARAYLLDHGVRSITYLTRRGGSLARETAPLE